MKKYMLFKLKIAFLGLPLAVMAMFFSGCWKSDSRNKASKLVVINVLDKDYYDDCHITGSVNVPFEELEDRVKSMNKKDSYVFYCSNYACTAAPFSAKMLKDAGAENVFAYHGGMAEWYQNKYPYTGLAQKSYLNDANSKFDDEDHAEIKNITADQLLSMMKSAKLLS